MNAEVTILEEGEDKKLMLNLSGFAGYGLTQSDEGTILLALFTGPEPKILRGNVAIAVAEVLRGLAGYPCAWTDSQRRNDRTAYEKVIELSPATRVMLRDAWDRCASVSV